MPNVSFLALPEADLARASVLPSPFTAFPTPRHSAVSLELPDLGTFTVTFDGADEAKDHVSRLASSTEVSSSDPVRLGTASAG